jgi:amino acid adenylation domain-containing protein
MLREAKAGLPQDRIREVLRERISAAKSPVQTIQRFGSDRARASFTQEGLWILEQILPQNTAYSILLPVRISGAVNALTVVASLEALIERHESLRTRFATTDGVLFQEVYPPQPFELTYHDLRAATDKQTNSIGDLLKEVQRHIEMEGRQPFDLSRGPLLRARLLRLNDEDHVLVFILHHIVGDATSLGVLVRDFCVFYAAMVDGRKAALHPLPIQYSDYSEWQRRLMQGDHLARHLDHWRARLKGMRTETQLPSDRPRPSIQSFRGATYLFGSSKKLMDALKAICQQEAATMYMLLVAALQLLISRWSGERDITIAAPVANRIIPETQGVIGLFVNLLPIRSIVNEELNFLEFLRQVKETALDAFDHSEIPFEKIIEIVQPKRDLSRHPLVQISFTLQKLSQTGAAKNLTITPFETGVVSCKLDLEIFMEESNDGLRGYVEYATDLFDRSTVERFIAQFKQLLERVALAPDVRLSTIPTLTDDELRERFASQRIPASADCARFEREEIEQPIARRFEAQVARAPTALAVTDDDVAWTYEELNAKANGIASAICSSTGSSAGVIALLFRQDATMIASILGVLKTNKTYVPLDPRLPSERLRFLLKNAAASAIFCETENLGLAGDLVASAPEIPVINVTAVVPMDHAPESARGPDALAYILYTSGTSGKPKGVLQNDRNVLHYMSVYTNALQLHSADRLTLFASYAFDASVMDIFGALLNGASLHIRDLRRVGIEGLYDWLKDRAISVWHSTPTVFRLAVSALAEKAPRSIRLVVLGGEEASPDDVGLLRANFSPDCNLINGFGPTEATIALQFIADRSYDAGSARLPIGRPVEHTRIILLDNNGMPTDMIGEIGIVSNHLALGYLGEAELTEERFRPAPFGGQERLYRTGDLGRWRRDGQLEYLGRLDQQVKIRGYRVELGEIEAVLSTHPSITHALVHVQRKDSEESLLVACCVGKDGVQPDHAVLRSHLEASLPDYMIPAAFVALERIPLTPNGKVDYRALPVPEGIRSHVDAANSPRTPTEIVIASIWCAVLNLDQVGIDEGFFELGGNSLLLIRAHAQIVEETGKAFPIAIAFQYPSIRRLAGYLDQKLKEVTDEAPELVANEQSSRRLIDRRRAREMARGRYDRE